MASGYRVKPVIAFNGKDVTGLLNDYLKDVRYEDASKDRCDSLDLTVHNINKEWLTKWYPKKGDEVICKLVYGGWYKDGSDRTVNCGAFIVDEISFSGDPMTMKISALGVPRYHSFTQEPRDAKWNKLTIEKMATKIGRRYQMKVEYHAQSISVQTAEQTDQDDAAFLYNICKTYGLNMKVYQDAIIIYDPAILEQKEEVATITPKSFVDESWSITDSLDGVFNGCYVRVGSGTDAKKWYFGTVDKDSPDARIVRIRQSADNQADAKYKALSAINAANEKAVKMSGNIWPTPAISAGTCVAVKDFGVPDGKYFVEQVQISLSGSDTTMNVTMHKIFARVRKV